MANSDLTDFKRLLQELDKNKLARLVVEKWDEQTKLQKRDTLIVVVSVLAVIVLLNGWSKLTPESNGWILAALIGYLFGRGQK